MSWKLKLGIALIVAIATWQVQTWRYGERIEKMRAAHSEALQQAEKQARDAENRLREKVERIDALTEQARNDVKVVTETVEKEVIRYVEKDPAAGSCTLSSGWVRAHNAATARVPEDADAAGLSDGAATGVTDITALRTVTGNYRICVEEEEKLRKLQSYVREVCLADNQ